MVEVKGYTATSVMKRSIDYVLNEGFERKVYGGTIPKDIKDPDSPNDFDRIMIEAEPGMTMVLNNPLARWTDYSDHWIGITLREQEDHLQGFNPGYVIKYSKLYPVWLNSYKYFNYTYGERLQHYPYNPVEKSGRDFFRNMNINVLNINQIERIVEMLKSHPTTRKACISTWYPPSDIGDPYCPCNMVFQVRVVDGKLDWITVVRSLDVLRGFSENLFMFTIWQEYVAKLLDMPLGKYTTIALNAHLYQDQIEDGYHKQNVPDCYDFYNPRPAFKEDFPAFQMKFIDDSLFGLGEKSFESAYKLARKLPDYWRNWKLALISEWERLQGRNENAMEAFVKIDNEFQLSVAKRLKRKMPKCLNALPWKDQKEFLKGG